MFGTFPVIHKPRVRDGTDYGEGDNTQPVTYIEMMNRRRLLLFICRRYPY